MWIDPPQFHVVALNHDDSVRKQHVDKYRVRQDVPVSLRKIAQSVDRLPRHDLPNMWPKLVGDTHVVEEDRRNAVTVKDAEVVGLKERIDGYFPVERLLDDTLLIEVIVLDIK